MEEIKAGDTVRVRSGGPVMTVSSVGEDTFGEMTAYCHWFDGKRAENGAFPVTVLAKADPSAGIGGVYVSGVKRT